MNIAKFCPECNSEMRYCVDTLSSLNNDDTQDNTNLVEAYQCIDCDYWNEV